MPSNHLTAAAAIISALSVAAAVSTPASAQEYGPSSPNYVYGTLGYTGHDVGSTDFGTIQGRLGVRLDRYFGVEGEIGTGVNRQGIGGGESARIGDQEAIYGVGYLPIAPHLDLFGRIGVGRTDWDYSGPQAMHSLDTSWNAGAGGQYFLDRHNGVRVEYTRENFDHAPTADDWSASYVHRF